MMLGDDIPVGENITETLAGFTLLIYRFGELIFRDQILFNK